MNPREIGKKYEVIVLQELQKTNPLAKLNGGFDGYKPEYAFYDFEDFDGIEVKGDEIADESNRYAFDKMTDGQPSGLGITKAKWHVLFTLSRYFIIKTDMLKWLSDYKDTITYLINDINSDIDLITFPNKLDDEAKKEFIDMYTRNNKPIIVFCDDINNQPTIEKLPTLKKLVTNIIHHPNSYNVESGRLMDFYLIPLPAIEMFAIESGKIEDFNLKAIE